MAKNWAICIGINHYENLTDLRFAVQDAESMQDWFNNEAGFEKVYLFTDNSPPITDASKSYPSQPSYGRLIRFLESRFNKDFLSIGDNLWFFFSGHGIRHGNRDYLMLSDSSAIGDLIERTGIAFSYVTERLKRSGAGNVIFITDACRNEGSSKGLGVGEQRHQGVISIASCSPSERSFEIEEKQQGSFTYALLEALRITGPGNCAVVERLDQRLRQRVPELTRQYKKQQQTPYVIAEPISKTNLILLPSQATLKDVSALRQEAYRAENNQDLELAKIFMTQVLIASPADSDALAWFKNIWLEELKYKHRFEMRDLEKSHQEKIQELELAARQDKKELERDYQNQKQALERSLKSEIRNLEQQLDQVRSQVAKKLEDKERSLQSRIEELEQALELARTSNQPPKNEVMRWREEVIERSYEQPPLIEKLGNDIKLEMIAIPSGKFMMGSPEGEGRLSEKPQHEVTVQPFFMGKYPITQAQYQQVMGKNPSKFKGDNQRPVEQVLWDDAIKFCKKLSKQTGKGYRLPTEAEWEYACRACTTTKYYFGDDITSDLANYDRNVGETTIVGKYPPNAFGLYDMHGNVWEWCKDNWHNSYKDAPNDCKAWVSGKSNKKVIRGGSWAFDPDDSRSAYRNDVSRVVRSSDLGFRVVCVFPSAT